MKIGNLLAELTDLLHKKCSNKNFVLICVMEENYARSVEQEIKDIRLVIKRIKKIAHYASTDKFDKEAWKEIYKNIRWHPGLVCGDQKLIIWKTLL